MINTHNTLLSQGARRLSNSKCRSCRRPIRFYKLRTGATAPFDPPNRELTNEPDNKPWQDWEMPSHFATCPDSEEHKRNAANRRTAEALASLFGSEPASKLTGNLSLPVWSTFDGNSIELCESPESLPDDGTCEMFTHGRLHRTDGTFIPCCNACAVRMIEGAKEGHGPSHDP